MKLRRTMKAQSPKKKEKKKGIILIIIKKKEEDLGQARGYAARRTNIKALYMFKPTQRPLKIQ